MNYSAALLEQNEAFGELFADIDQSTPVLTCPGWTLRQLFRHVGRGDRWAAQIIDDRRTDYLDPRETREGRPPDDAAGAIDWLHGGARGLVAAVDRVGADTAVWTFLGARPAQWWIRRRLHEATVHRADVMLTLGLDYKLAPELAADGITEWLERVVLQADAAAPPLVHGRSLHLCASDTGHEWLISAVGDGALRLETGPARDSGVGVQLVDVTGPASELLLAIVRRRSAEDAGLTITGDAGVWLRWLDHTPF